MSEVRANGIDLCYEAVGDSADPALLLVMGLGGQLIDWPQEFVELLAGRGYYVVRYDNRDAGRSSLLDDRGTPDIPAIIGGDPATVPYLLADLAADAAGLLKALGIASAHVVGMSMGGMVAQQLAIDHPALVASLCSIMSTTARSVGRPTAQAAAVLIRPPASSRDEAVANAVECARVVGSPGYPPPRERVESIAGEAYDRSYRPQGTLRQYAAIIASPDRTAALGAVRVPTMVIHGADDPLIRPDGGEATAAAVPGAELLVIPGMAHDLPPELWPQIVAAIVRNAATAPPGTGR